MPDADLVLSAAQCAWLTLCAMMLLSRFVFAAMGATAMRAFLDAWKDSTTHRAWGWGALAAGLALAACALGVAPRLGAGDAVLVASVVLVLCADGLLNLFPGWFGHFKERLQAAWVKRHGDSPRAGDTHLFGTVNLALGTASLAVGAAAWWHRPLGLAWIVGAGVAACALTSGLIAGCLAEARGRGAAHGGS
jgi:hypothetical protein